MQVARLRSLVGEVPHVLWPKKKKNKERERETVSNVLTLPSQSGTSAVCSVKDGLDCAAKNVGRKKGEE